MKTKIRRMSRRTLALVLGVLMLATCLLVGDISVANAWTYNSTYLNIKIGTGSWTGYNTSTGYVDFELGVDTSIEFTIYVDGKEFRRNSSYDNPTAANLSNGDNVNARDSDWGANNNFYVSSMKAGKYVFHIGGYWDDQGTTKHAIYFQMYRKKGMYDGGGTSGAWSSTEMDYNGTSNGSAVYKLDFTGDGNQKRFRTRYVDGSTETKYYPSQSSYDIKNKTSYDDGYVASTGTSDNYFYFDTVLGGSYTVWLQNGRIWLTYSLPTPKIYGALGSGWNSTTYDMTATETAGVYSYTYTATNGGDQYYRFKIGDNYYRANRNDNNDENVSLDSGSPTTAVSNGTNEPNNRAFKFSSTASKSYTVYVNLNGSPAPTTWVEDNATQYYLTGWLNDAEVTGKTNQFTDNGDGTYSLAFSPTSDHGGYQYMTIWDGTTAYHPVTHGSGSGTAGTNTDSSPGADNKWKVAAVSGQTVNLTWNSSTHILSWTVTGGSSGGSWNGPDVSGWGTTSSYKILLSFGVNTNLSNVLTTKKLNSTENSNTGQKYYAEITDSTMLNNLAGEYSKFYCGISTNGENNGVPSDSVSVVVNTTNSPLLNTGGGYGQEENSLGTGSNRRFARAETKSGYTKGSITRLGILVEKTSSGWTYTFYTNDPSSSGEGEEITSVTVYAKDGAAPINWDNKTAGGASNTSGTAYNFAAVATTTISQIDGATPASGVVSTFNCGDSGSQYQSAAVEVGKSIQIKTTIDSSRKSKYYVKGWCINGVTYKCNGSVGVNEASDTNTSTGVCTMTYTIPSDITEGYLEITPIYYLRDNSDCITFYLEGYNTVQEKWGNTPYVYPFYGDLNNVDNSFGCYPGQPLVYDAGGKYSTEIPITNDPIIKATSNIKVKGITISNGYADHVHRNVIYGWTDHDNDADHKQTYDYDDFYKIYEECLTNAAGQDAGHPNSIIFRIQDEEKTYNRYTYGGSKSGARVLANKNSLSSADLSNINSNNGWEVLRNRYGQAVDIFGNTVSEPSTEATAFDSNTVRVVSTGYNANIAGDYGTAWKVYKYNTSTSYSLIQDSTNGRYAAPPSIFLLRGTSSGYSTDITYPSASRSVVGVGNYTDSISSYEGIYKAAKANTVAGKPVYITYEKDAQDTRDNASGTGAYRLDGRWYYTHDTDVVHSTIEIQYFDKSQNKWLTDTISASTGLGSTSGCTAKFDSDSYSSSSAVTTSNNKIINAGESWNFTATAGTGFMFDSWQIKYSNTSFDKIPGAGASASIDATANYTLVARFMPVVTGSLTIDHTLAKASTGEGTVDMQVDVWTNSGKTSRVGTQQTGSHVYLNGTYISNSFPDYYIEVTLKTTPQYDGKVTAFGYDKFNTDKSITATTSPASLPGNENSLTTSTFGFTVSQLYAGATLTTSELTYTSTIAETPHYYNFTYNFTNRSGVSKSYTAKGEISLKDYKQYVTNQSTHTMGNDILVAKAPFESNFLKSNTLSRGAISYTSGTHTYSATSTFTQADSVPTYHVLFKLPYNYYTTAGSGYKKYNANGTTYNSGKEAFDLAAKYNTFVTVNATDTTPDTAQANVEKVTDSTDVNHTGNNFLTVPDTLKDSSTTMYFSYWLVKKGSSEGDIVTKIYYPDFNYRVYSNYYVEAVYSASAADSWHMNYREGGNENTCSIMYLGGSRNQWNNSNGTTYTDSTSAADKIYNDFIFKYDNNGRELKNATDVEIGMIIERVPKSMTAGSGWVTGSSSVTDMNSYAAANVGTLADRKASILSGLSSGTLPAGCVKSVWSTSGLNTKNFMEQNWSAYSQYGQKTEDGSIVFNTDSTIDDYLYRAYAYMKYDTDNDGTADTYVLSDPAYFCMKYTSSLKYTE